MPNTLNAREVADDYVARYATLDPVSATMTGILGHDCEMTDYSPAGLVARVDLARETLQALLLAVPNDDDERRGAALLATSLRHQVEEAEAGEPLRRLRILGSPVQAPRQVFDLMARETPEDWDVIATRLKKVPAALVGFRASLGEGARTGVVAARRQALACAAQASTWAGNGTASPFFIEFVAAADSANVSARLRRQLDSAARAATQAYSELAQYLTTDYAPRAEERDGVGADRYQLAARHWLGAEIDPVATYTWGWDELHRIEDDLLATAGRIQPGASVEEVRELLETDPRRCIDGVDAFRAWLQSLMDDTIEKLNGVHFDIAEPVHRVEAMIAPPGGAAAMYYTSPSQDFSRPGRTWYPTLGKTRFPLWGEVSIAYHEGVPGHHLQIAQVVYLGERLSTYQRSSFVSGHGEGWALYAERLMDELGYLDNPDYRMGMLRAQAMRAVRVIIDIGMHLELEIPATESFHPGERWTPELGEAFANERSQMPADFMASEVVRYLGLPGQAISYKVGERVWLEAREEVKRRKGAAFDLKAFHAAALDLGPLGLDQLREELLAI